MNCNSTCTQSITAFSFHRSLSARHSSIILDVVCAFWHWPSYTIWLLSCFFCVLFCLFDFQSTCGHQGSEYFCFWWLSRPRSGAIKSFIQSMVRYWFRCSSIQRSPSLALLFLFRFLFLFLLITQSICLNTVKSRAQDVFLLLDVFEFWPYGPFPTWFCIPEYA